MCVLQINTYIHKQAFKYALVNWIWKEKAEVKSNKNEKTCNTPKQQFLIVSSGLQSRLMLLTKRRSQQHRGSFHILESLELSCYTFQKTNSLNIVT